MDTHQNFIGGAWRPATSGATYVIRNPARPSDALGEFADATAADACEAVTAAAAAASEWASTPGPARGALLLRLAQLIVDDADQLARVVTLEQGKALAESKGEVLRAAAELRYMAGEASRPIGQSYPSERPGVTCTTTTEPIGVVAAICPWNFPVVTPVRKLAPALAWGNTVVLKPSFATPWSVVRLAHLAERAGFPAGVLNVITGAGVTGGEALVRDPRVAGISFTGSTATGTQIYGLAARRLARVQLELGGKNPAVVIDHDDLDAAAREIVAAAFLCSGQRCTALSRVIVTHDAADALVSCILQYVDRIVVGDGLTSGTTMGPLVSERHLQSVDRYVQQALAAGVALLRGGGPVADAAESGYFYQPTVFDHVDPSSALAREEVFGPVLPILRVADLEEAISVANDTKYGLAASVFTSRMQVANEFATRVVAGMIHVNHGTASQAHVPFGGVKASGQGAYSIGPTAREFFTNVKAVYIRW